MQHKFQRLYFIWQGAPVILKPRVHKEDPQEDVHCVVKQHIQLKYVPCRGGHFAKMFLCQETQTSEIEKKNEEVGEQLCNFHHIVFLISSQFSKRIPEP